MPWVIGALIIGFLLFHRSPKAKPAAAVTAATTTSSAAPESAAGKPCVAPVDPLPAGAPAVPVEVGPAPTKLVVKDLKRGTGATVTDTDSVTVTVTVTVNYVGVACSTGKTFATSYPNGTVTIPLDQVIPGWTKGVAGMKLGGERLLGVPSNEAYGADGAPPLVAPDGPVWFVIEVTATRPDSVRHATVGPAHVSPTRGRPETRPGGHGGGRAGAVRPGGRRRRPQLTAPW